MTPQSAREKLFALRDLGYRDFSSKLTPGEENMIGVRVPKVREIAKEIAAGDYREFLKAPYTEYHEECLLWGLVLGYLKTDIEELLTLVDAWLPCVKNWAVCDCSIMTIKAFSKPQNADRVFSYFTEKLAATREPYIRRACIVGLFNNFLGGKRDREVAELFAGVSDEHYYVKMALAWGIAELLIKDYSVGLELLESNRLLCWVQNKAIQKACESFRISDEQKLQLKGLKRKDN